MGTNRDMAPAAGELARALEASSARLDALEARVAELERQNDELRALTEQLAEATQQDAGDAEGADHWVESVPEDRKPVSSSDLEILRLRATLVRSPNDTRVLARLAERAELIGDLALAVDTLERLADEFPAGRERRRALLHAARLARTALDDAPRALGLARTVLVDHPADAEARRLVALYALR